MLCAFILITIRPSYALVDVYTCTELKSALNNPEGDSDIEVCEDLILEDPLGVVGKSYVNIKGQNHTLNGNNKEGLELRGSEIEVQGVRATNFHSQRGGVINNTQGSVKNLKGEFYSNSAEEDGGVIYNNSGAISIEGEFNNNFSNNNGGVIYNNSNGKIDNVEGTFNNNKAELGSGGVIFNYGEIENIKGEFNNNSAKMGLGGAISSYEHTSSIEGNFKNNEAMVGGAIYLWGNTDKIKGNFEGNRTEGGMMGGGAIANMGVIGDLSGTFKNNVSDGRGGGIYNMETINITSNDSETVFSSNRDALGSNAIYNNGGTINFRAGKYDIIIDDKITGGEGQIARSASDSNINIENKNEGKLIINNEIKDNTVNLYEGVLKFSNATTNETQTFGNLDSRFILTVTEGQLS